MSGKIGDIEEIENFPEDVQFASFAEPNDLAEPNVCREETVAEIEVRGKSDSWNQLTCRSAFSRQAGVIVVNQSPKIRLAQTPIQFVPLRPWQQIVDCAVSVEVNPRNLCAEWGLAQKGGD